MGSPKNNFCNYTFPSRQMFYLTRGEYNLLLRANVITTKLVMRDS